MKLDIRGRTPTLVFWCWAFCSEFSGRPPLKLWWRSRVSRMHRRIVDFSYQNLESFHHCPRGNFLFGGTSRDSDCIIFSFRTSSADCIDWSNSIATFSIVRNLFDWECGCTFWKILENCQRTSGWFLPLSWPSLYCLDFLRSFCF